MVLVCPHCAAHSRVDDAQARRPQAEVHCGHCSKSFFVSAAHKVAGASEISSPRGSGPGPEAGAAAKVPLTAAFWARGLALVVLPLALMALCLWDVRKVAYVAAPLRADVRVASAQTAGPAAGLAFMEVHIEPRRALGASDGLVVRGQVVNSGAAPARFVPEILAQVAHRGLKEPIVARLAANFSEAAHAATAQGQQAPAQREATLVQPGQTLTFEGLIPLPEAPSDLPWDVLVTWSEPGKSAAQGS